MPQKVSKSAEAFKHGIILFVIACALYPLLVTVIISFKTNAQYEANPFWFDPISTWNWGNWSKAWDTVSPYIANSIVVSVSATSIGLVMIILSSYALARYHFPGRNIIYYGIIASMFLPGTAATLVTVFWLIRNLGLVNNLWALIIVGAAGA
ncbi:MAG: hypothetical protein AAGA25_10025, partial [Planctomycetota bacterium]